jgi:PrgI family protein
MAAARAPLDVDLEDRLLYGLTPTRLVYLVVALLAAFSAWSGQWAPIPVRVACAAILALAGAAAAWGRWHGRPVDAWLIDIVIFIRATYRIRLRRPWPRRC